MLHLLRGRIQLWRGKIRHILFSFLQPYSEVPEAFFATETRRTRGHEDSLKKQESLLGSWERTLPSVLCVSDADACAPRGSLFINANHEPVHEVAYRPGEIAFVSALPLQPGCPMLLVCFRLVCQALALLLEGRDLRFHLCHLLLARGYPVQHFLARKGFEGIERLIVRDDILDD